MKSENRNASAEMWRFLNQVSSGPLARAGLKSLALQIAAIVFGLVQAVILARLLGATDYGMFATAAGVSAILAAVAVGGFDQYAVRELSRLRTDGELPTALAFIRFGNRWVLVASVLGGGALAAIAAVYAGGDTGWRTTFMLAGAATPLATMLLLRAGQLRGLGAVVIAQVPIAVVRPAAMIALLAAFWIAGLTMTAPHAMTAWLVACIAALLLASAALRPRTVALDVAAPVHALSRQWLTDAAPFLGSTVVVIVFSQINTLMLAALAGAEAAGLYQPIAYLAPVMNLPVAALAMPFAPRVVELWRRGHKATLRRTTWMYTTASFAGTCIIGMGVVLFGGYGLGFFGQEFVAASPALVWIVAATIVFAALGPSEILLSMMDAQVVVLAASIFGLTLTVVLATFLIPIWGVEGAAMAFAAAIVAGRMTMLVAMLRRFGIDPSLVGALTFAVSKT